MTSRDLDHEDIKALSIKLGRPLGTLIALAHCNDPFTVSLARVNAARWFIKLWRRFQMGTNVHPRRIHYRLLSAERPVLDVYRHWSMLVQACRDGRYLKLIPRGTIIDRKNDEPIVHVTRYSNERGSIFLSDGEPDTGEITKSPNMPDLPKVWLSAPNISQRYHVELWCEKTTINDILGPLAQQYGCNVVTGSGELSLTACENVVDRAVESKRPVRILYISDFDPGGMSMPVAVARKIEWRIRTDDRDLDLQVRPIALTHEQCIEYRLPRTPIKETERRAANFEDRFGEGATELDAMEAIRPGELRKIIEREILRYYDGRLQRKINMVADRIRRDIGAANESVHNTHSDEIEQLSAEWQEIVDEFEANIDEWRARAESVWERIADDLNDLAPDLSKIEWPEPDEGNEDEDPLFDSTRDYVEQIDRYKEHQQKPTERRVRSDFGKQHTWKRAKR